MIKNSRPILILGASGWIAHYLIGSIKCKDVKQEIIGVSRANQSAHNIKFYHMENSQYDKIMNLIKKIEPHTVINMARGETDADYHLHLKLIEILKSRNIYYVYYSSSMATDAIWDKPYSELTRGMAQSSYGKFKAKCEQALIEQSKNFLAFRFAATHGYSPNRISRTEKFLKRLSDGEKIEVTNGIYQNRTYVSDLADMMSALILKNALGIVHLGTIDESDECEFLKKLAVGFGYESCQVVPVKSHKTLFCSTHPQKMFDYLDESYQIKELATIKKLINISEFCKYRKSTNGLFFKPLVETDLVIIKKWLQEPHVKEFWKCEEDWNQTCKKYVSRISTDDVNQFIVYFEDKPIGQIQFYWVSRMRDCWCKNFPEDVIGIDQYIDEFDYMGKGIGSKMIKTFIKYLRANYKFSKIITDPSPKNSRAIRCYEKVGFKKNRIIPTQEGDVFLMELMQGVVT